MCGSVLPVVCLHSAFSTKECNINYSLCYSSGLLSTLQISPLVPLFSVCKSCPWKEDIYILLFPVCQQHTLTMFLVPTQSKGENFEDYQNASSYLERNDIVCKKNSSVILLKENVGGFFFFFSWRAFVRVLRPRFMTSIDKKFIAQMFHLLFLGAYQK